MVPLSPSCEIDNESQPVIALVDFLSFSLKMQLILNGKPRQKLLLVYTQPLILQWFFTCGKS